MKKLSLVMITKNEELKLRRCLESVKDFVNEIIIVDTGSTDKTKNIALEFDAKIYDYEWDDNFSNARNHAISKSTGDWNLILDADEYITRFNLEEIHKFMSYNENTIGQIKIVNSFEQDGDLRKSNTYISRLAPKGTYFSGSIHEQLDLKLSRKEVDIIVEHDGYLNTNKYDRNINLILKELQENNDDTYLLYQAAKTYYSNKMYKEAEPYFDKFYNQVDINTDAFFKDGIILYLYNLIKINNLAKGLTIIDDVFDFMNKYSDFYFVCGIFFTELIAYDTKKYLSYFDNIELCYLNALKLGDSSDSIEGTGSFLAAYNLGIFYELINCLDKSTQYYQLSASYNYLPAKKKLSL